MRLPLLYFACELIAGDDPAGVDVLQTDLNLVEHIEPVDDFVERDVIEQALDGLDGFLLGGMSLHRGSREYQPARILPVKITTVAAERRGSLAAK
jgi:hypothetical protein